MDQTTHKIRRANWQEIINQCQNRKSNTTVKQWCLDNGINEKSYYYWLRKFRREATGQMAVPADMSNTAPVAFAEMPFACNAASSDSAKADTIISVHPTAVFKHNNLTIAITNEISDSLLSRIIQEVSHA